MSLMTVVVRCYASAYIIVKGERNIAIASTVNLCKELTIPINLTIMNLRVLIKVITNGKLKQNFFVNGFQRINL